MKNLFFILPSPKNWAQTPKSVDFFYKFNFINIAAGIAAKEWTCVPYNRDRNRDRYRMKKVIDAAKKLGKSYSAIN